VDTADGGTRVTWFKVDDGFATHPKAITLSDAAVAIWTRAGSWCSYNLTDGHFPKAMLPVLRGKPSAAAALVKAGLWITDPAGDGWWFHDWHDYQPTREKKLAERAAAADRQRRAREAARARRDTERSNGRSHAVTAGVTDPVTTGVSSDVTAPVSHGPPDPTRPVVVVTNPSQSSSVTRESQTTDDDLDKIQAELQRHTHAAIDHAHAARVRDQILDNAPDPPRRPAAYVTAAIRDDPGRYLPAAVPDPVPIEHRDPDPALIANGVQQARQAITRKANA
jgi:hypothetical protein